MAKSNHGKAEQEDLENLHGALARALSDKIKSGDCTAADLAVARQFLKDNSIDSIPTEGSGLKELSDALPFANPEEDQAEE